MNTEKLDEAAVKYQIDTYGPRVIGGAGILSDEEFMQWNKNIDFIAGAKWMAEQGVTTEQTVGRTPLNGPNGVTVFLYDFDGFQPGDKVIVQIRKKEK